MYHCHYFYNYFLFPFCQCGTCEEDSNQSGCQTSQLRAIILYFLLSGILHALDCSYLGSYWSFHHEFDTKPFTLDLQWKATINIIVTTSSWEAQWPNG